MKNVTIKDLAKITGFSVATISRVINNNGRFSEETREKVLDAIKKTGYQMNYSAKNLRMNKSFSIGIIVPDISNYFFNQLVQKIEILLFNNGYSTIICNTDRSIEKEKSYIKTLENKGVDGIIIVSGNQQFKFEDVKLPYICIDREPLNKKNTIFISSDHFDGGYKATSELIKHGCKNPAIAMVKDRESTSSNLRFAGFLKALKDYELDFDPNISIVYLDKKEEVNDDIVNHLQKNNIDGLFTINDFIAFKFIDKLKYSHFNIPEDIKIIGFDDNFFNKFITPKLSSIYQDLDLISQASVDSLLKMLDKDIVLGQSISIPIEVHLRESVVKKI